MLRPVWNPFSRYADKQEKIVDRILRNIAFLGVFEAQRKILELMQSNLVILDLWLEARFKGYKYLNKSTRKRLYKNSERIVETFLEFSKKTPIDLKAVANNLRNLGLKVPGAPGDDEKLRLITAMMLFLRPGAGRFEYLEGASFGKLLADPDGGKKMIGDCNQIVTFYTFLYSRKFKLEDLQIKIMKEHVCLHFKGVDIEATSGSFAKYDQYLKILPIVELISTNLLDVSDFRDKQIHIDARDFLKAAHLANSLSSETELVKKNLKAAYHNMAVEAVKTNNFENAAFFLEKSGLDTEADAKFLSDIFHNAVIYNVSNHQFKSARYYADKKGDNELKKYIDEQEALSLYNSGSLDRARELFSRAGNRQMVKACYAKEYNKVQARVAGLKLLSEMKSHRSDYQKMIELANKMEDYQLVESLRKFLSQI